MIYVLPDRSSFPEKEMDREGIQFSLPFSPRVNLDTDLFRHLQNSMALILNAQFKMIRLMASLLRILRTS